LTANANSNVLKDPWVTSKQLKASLTLANVHIRRTLNNNGVKIRFARRKPLLFKNIAVHVDKPESYWKNVLWID
uniref:Transposase Tc1-like domain-containing protein n=1 Tax=Astyanax mexicanus TaxID=7994 RepID=A0A3B1JND9_ASTMX